jgi:hypothetical protein
MENEYFALELEHNLQDMLWVGMTAAHLIGL